MWRRLFFIITPIRASLAIGNNYCEFILQLVRINISMIINEIDKLCQNFEN